MKNVLLILTILALISCQKKEPSVPTDSKIDSVRSTESQISTDSSATESTESFGEDTAIYEVVASVEGDLDKDGVAEKVEVVNLEPDEEGNMPRELQIFKQDGVGWKLWHKTTGPLFGSNEGGSRGDPIENGLSIERGCIVLNQITGGTASFEYTHRFRFQNGDWFLIGATFNSHWQGEFEESDFNLSTGKYSCTKGHIDQDESDYTKFSGKTEQFKHTKMNGFVPGSIVCKDEANNYTLSF